MLELADLTKRRGENHNHIPRSLADGVLVHAGVHTDFEFSLTLLSVKNSFILRAVSIEWDEGLLRGKCDIARALNRIVDWKVKDFGSSDCVCKSHLLGMAEDPLHARHFIDLMQYFRIDRLEKYL